MESVPACDPAIGERRSALVTLNRNDLGRLIEWTMAKAFEGAATTIEIPYDFYWCPDQPEDLFELDAPPTLTAVGSIADELDLLGKSVIEGDGFDIADIVAERLAFLLLAVAAALKRRTASGAS